MLPHRPFRPSPVRRAFTLVELLVAVAIAALLVAIAIPALKLNMRGQSVREAARQINSFIDEARSQAAGSGRPYGIVIERDGNGSYGNPRRAFRLYHCEVPTPYTGDLLPAPESPDPRLRLGSRAYITPNDPSVGGVAETAVLTYASLRMIMPGDEIAFDGSSTRYRIVNATNLFPPVTTPHATRVRIVFGAATAPPPATSAETPPTDLEPWNPATMGTIALGHSFRVYRQPVKIASSVLELPRSAAIDLDWSGFGAGGVQFSEFNQVVGTARTQEYALNPIVILFEPSGSVRNVQAPLRIPLDSTTTPPTPEHLSLTPFHVTEPIFFLIGRMDQVEDQATPAANWIDPNAEFLSNAMDRESLWIKVNPSDGMTLTVENIGPANRDPVTAVETGWPAANNRGVGARNARVLARVSAGAGG